MSEIIRLDLPSVAALDAVLRERDRPDHGDYRPEAQRWRWQEERRRRRENALSYLGDDEIEAALVALRSGDERTVQRIERRLWRRVEANLPGRRRLSPEVTRHNPGSQYSGHGVCMAEGKASADSCQCITWFLDEPRDSRFHDPWAIHVHRERVREQRRAIREAPAREVFPLLPGRERRRRPVAELMPGRRVRALLPVGGTTSAAAARLPDIDMDWRR